MGYLGHKNIEGVYHKIINEIPPHKRYVELFLGSGAILKTKLPAPIQSIGVEIDKKTISEGDWDKFEKHYNLRIITGSAIDFLKNTPINQDTFIYADPPYPLSSRRNMDNAYRYEMTDMQHIQFLKIVVKLKCNIAISTYPNPIYTKLLKDWRVISFKVQTRRGLATELLYMNYPAPTQLHDYRYLGKDFTQRQMIKRKIDRHVSRLKKLPALERAAIIHHILKNNSDIR